MEKKRKHPQSTCHRTLQKSLLKDVEQAHLSAGRGVTVGEPQNLPVFSHNPQKAHDQMNNFNIVLKCTEVRAFGRAKGSVLFESLQ